VSPSVSTVVAAFSAGGDVSDYDQAALDGIKTAIAIEAAIATSAVSLDISPGSVIITATVVVPAARAASSVDALSTGMFSSPSRLQKALSAAGVVGVAVEAIQTAPMAVSSLSSPASPPSPSPSSEGGIDGGADDVIEGGKQGVGTGLIAGIAVAAILAVLVPLCILLRRQRRRMGPVRRRPYGSTSTSRFTSCDDDGSTEQGPLQWDQGPLHSKDVDLSASAGGLSPPGYSMSSHIVVEDSELFAAASAEELLGAAASAADDAIKRRKAAELRQAAPAEQMREVELQAVGAQPQGRAILPSCNYI